MTAVATWPQWVQSADGTWMPRWPKDPDDVEDYTLDWSRKLAPADTLISCVFTPVAISPVSLTQALTVLSQNVTDTQSTGWISGGWPLGQIYEVLVRVVTLEGRQHDRTFQLIIGQN